MRELVDDRRHQAAVARDDRRRDERQPRVLHPAVGKLARHDQHVVAVPAEGPASARRPRAFVGRSSNSSAAASRRAGSVHTPAFAERAEFQVADRERDQVGRDRLLHLEAIFAGRRRAATRAALITATSFGRRAQHVRCRSRGRPGVSCTGSSSACGSPGPGCRRRVARPEVCAGSSHCSALASLDVR